MDFKKAAALATYLAKDHAERMFELLVKYRDISASEAASRMGLHIRTAQDFLEGMTDLGILSREEVYEKTRPYYRYSLKADSITINIDLLSLIGDSGKEGLSRIVRERKNAGVHFTTARNGRSISAITAWTGTGRGRKEHRIKLTAAQGRFLFHLPFPDAEALAVSQIMANAGIDPEFSSEILDLVAILDQYRVLDSVANA